MRRTLLTALLAGLLVTAGWQGGPTAAVGQIPFPPGSGGPDRPERRFPDFQSVIKGAKEHDGYFKLYHKEDNVYAEIQPFQFNQPWLCSISVARGGGLGGYMLNFDEEWVLTFKRVGDKVHLIRRNIHFKARPGSPVARAVETTYTDSVLMALRIVTINPMKQAVLINLNDIFMTNFAQLPFGMMDPSRSTWHKVKTFPKNVELQVQATFAGGRGFGRGDGSVIDPRGNTVLVHYGMVQLPDPGYQPRLADDRVGYFLSAVKDFSSDSKDTSFIRYVRRWRVEPAEPIDPKGKKLVAPKKKIVFWIEKSVPDEYRAYVREGILEWNKAFEKIGLRDVIEVRQQEDDASGDFDPEDVRYSTFRWITTDMGFAMGPSRANPLTGEIIDADIIFDASMVRFWKQEYKMTRSGTAVSLLDQPSSIKAARLGWGLDHPLLRRPGDDDQGWNEPRKADAKARAVQLRAFEQGLCQCGAHMKYELGLAAMAAAMQQIPAKPGEKGPADKEKVPEELIGQAIKHVVMHEVGHTLGLRHNFKASTMLKNEDLHNTAITRKQGLVGSVMDYSPANIARKGQKQGDYFSVVLGPYDYWAIEYAYKPLGGGTDGEYEKLKELANRGAMPGHDYGTDEDTILTEDPLINRWDLGADPAKFGQDRILLAQELMKELADKAVDKGEGYQRTRMAFSLILQQYGNGAYLTVRHVGGEHAHRDHKGDPNGRDPLVPVKADKQRESLKFLQENILTDKPFQFPPALLRKLAVDRWSHWGSRMSSTDYPVHQRVLNIQRIVLDHVLDPEVLQRIQNNSLKVDGKDEKPLTVAEVFRMLTEGIWSDLPNGGPKHPVQSSIVRRNLQREHLKDLSNLVLGQKQDGYYSGSSAPPDARSLARMHLREIGKRIDATLNDKETKLDDTTRAHLEESRERIAKVLGASITINEP